MTQQGFDAVVTLLEGAFRTTLTAKERDAYYAIWSDQPDDAMKRAAVAFCRSEQGRFGFPKPGDLISHGPSDKEIHAIAVQALHVFEQNNIQDHDAVFEDRTIHAVIDQLGGWIACCEAVRTMPDKEYGFWKRGWLNLYAEFYVRPPDGIPDRMEGHYRNRLERVTCGYLATERRVALPPPAPDPLRLVASTSVPVRE